MSPTESTKERIFYQLAEYLDAGVSLPKAISQFAEAAAHRQVRRVLRALEAGGSGRVGADFQAVGFSEFDAGMIEAGERGGRLAEAFRLLEIHYTQRIKWRAAVRAKLIYPVFVFHFGAILLSIPPAILADSSSVFWIRSLSILGIAYGIAFALWGVWRSVKTAMRSSALFERVVDGVPFLGGVLRAVRSERFAQALAMQLRAGVTVLSAMQAAAIASGSRGLQEECREVEERVRRGSGLASAFGRNSRLAPELIEAIATGEQTGRLDTQCLRIADLLAVKVRRWSELCGEWLARLIYFAVAGFVAWQIVTTLQNVYSKVGSVLDM